MCVDITLFNEKYKRMTPKLIVEYLYHCYQRQTIPGPVFPPGTIGQRSAVLSSSPTVPPGAATATENWRCRKQDLIVKILGLILTDPGY